ncbi:MarR family transcriptional regulator [Chelatococcus sp. SYSU_G07232]|uniref:MarR family transcriptional regulator n=1 Tax=Chelatococcus albus TaxID=3047466 RepID=A0ABT7AFF0_9HYPH|nr:MarR family transcriptional regulator [Chelatococcus sp. SYSU_G07232]MDJ1157732.1 MarR family transcriptional regulator [Chelatococcus sp. SYSU_G07232]
MAGVTEAPVAAERDVNLLRVWFRFIRMERRLFAAIGLRLREIGLSIPQFDLLSTLTEREGISQQELAERLYVTKGNVSGLVDRLVAGDLVERRALAGDRRSHALFLTPKGRALAEEGIAIQRAYVTETLGRLPDRDLEELERIILAWRDILRAQDAAPKPAARRRGAASA